MKDTHQFSLLLDMTAVDERARTQPAADRLSCPSLCGVFPNADWYEREAWNMFRINFEAHPDLRRILMSESWVGQPLRKDHVSRATKAGPFVLDDDYVKTELTAMQNLPVTTGFVQPEEDYETVILNLGPNHPSLHGVLRLVVKLRGEEIVGVLPEIGFHHRGGEKIGDRQSSHSFIPYTDRIDYVVGVMNNLTYVLAVEQMAGIFWAAALACMWMFMPVLGAIFLARRRRC